MDLVVIATKAQHVADALTAAAQLVEQEGDCTKVHFSGT